MVFIVIAYLLAYSVATKRYIIVVSSGQQKPRIKQNVTNVCWLKSVYAFFQ